MAVSESTQVTAGKRHRTSVRIYTLLAALAFAVFIIVRTLTSGINVPGYASLMVAILFLGGLQLLSLGVLGEYVGRILTETKGRPLYVVRETIGEQEPS